METKKATNVKTLIKFPFSILPQIKEEFSICTYVQDGNNIYATIPGSRYQVPERLKKVLIGEPRSC